MISPRAAARRAPRHPQSIRQRYCSFSPICDSSCRRPVVTDTGVPRFGSCVPSSGEYLAVHGFVETDCECLTGSQRRRAQVTGRPQQHRLQSIRVRFVSCQIVPNRPFALRCVQACDICQKRQGLFAPKPNISRAFLDFYRNLVSREILPRSGRGPSPRAGVIPVHVGHAASFVLRPRRARSERRCKSK